MIGADIQHFFCPIGGNGSLQNACTMGHLQIACSVQPTVQKIFSLAGNSYS